VLSRRSVLKGAALAVAAPMINRRRFSLFARTDSPYSARTLGLVRSSTVIDMLGLLTLDFNKFSTWTLEPRTFDAADFNRLKDSGITIFHPAVGYTTGDVYTSSLRYITELNVFITEHGSDFLRVDQVADLERAKATGKIGIVVGQQNSVHFRTIADVDRFYAMGQRVSQLTYDDNRLGGGSADPLDGLSTYGAQIVARMNSVGMAIDVSHCSDRTTLDAIEASNKPVLVTHSNCRALVPHSERCKTDEAIKRLAAKGGVLGVTMVRSFVHSSGPATIDNVLDHVDHIAQLVGVEHAGVGSDVDLRGRDVRRSTKKYDLDGMDYAQKIFDLTEGLVRRKYSDENIQLILGGNFRRALSEIWLA
jgi:membrane dipeptidase